MISTKKTFIMNDEKIIISDKMYCVIAVKKYIERLSIIVMTINVLKKVKIIRN